MCDIRLALVEQWPGISIACLTFEATRSIYAVDVAQEESVRDVVFLAAYLLTVV
jgi:hypothetical protein